jgi:TPR repeat protein
MSVSKQGDASNDWLSLGEEFQARGSLLDALSCFTAAGLEQSWEGWLRVAQLIEDRDGLDDSLSLFFRQRYVGAVKAAADCGDVDALHRLCGLYEFGQPGFDPDPPRALRLLEQLASAGDAEAQFELFEKHFYGLCSAPCNKTVALEWLRMAAQGEHAEAKRWLTGMQTWEEQGFQYPRSGQIL